MRTFYKHNNDDGGGGDDTGRRGHAVRGDGVAKNSKRLSVLSKSTKKPSTLLSSFTSSLSSSLMTVSPTKQQKQQPQQQPNTKTQGHNNSSSSSSKTQQQHTTKRRWTKRSAHSLKVSSDQSSSFCESFREALSFKNYLIGLMFCSILFSIYSFITQTRHLNNAAASINNDGFFSLNADMMMKPERNTWPQRKADSTDTTVGGILKKSQTKEREKIFPGGPTKPKIHVVISHCDASIRWTWEQYLYPHQFDTMTVITKCGAPISIREFPQGTKHIYTHSPSSAASPVSAANDFTSTYYLTPDDRVIQVLDLPNVGRCDHSYLYFIQQLTEYYRDTQNRKRLERQQRNGKVAAGGQGQDQGRGLHFWRRRLLGNVGDDKGRGVGNDDVVRKEEENRRRQQQRDEEDGDLILRLLPKINFTGYDFDFEAIEWYDDDGQPDEGDADDGDDVDTNDLILFMKDNDNSYRGEWEDSVPFRLMYDHILGLGENKDGGVVPTDLGRFDTHGSSGFVCSGQISTSAKVYDASIEVATNIAGRVEIGAFQMDEYAGARESDINNNDVFISQFRPMYKWLEYLMTVNEQNDDETDGSSNGKKIILPAVNFSLSPIEENMNQVIPVCFGGRFMTTLDRIVNNEHVNDWTKLLRSLSRGDNIEEGHYMERMWAPLLSKPIPIDVQHDWLRRKVRHFTKHTIIGLISVTPDGKPPFQGAGSDNGNCFNCRLVVPVGNNEIIDDGVRSEGKIDRCRMIDHDDSKAFDVMTPLDRCYTIMQLRECPKNDKFERRWRIEKDQCQRAERLRKRKEEMMNSAHRQKRARANARSVA